MHVCGLKTRDHFYAAVKQHLLKHRQALLKLLKAAANIFVIVKYLALEMNHLWFSDSLTSLMNLLSTLHLLCNYQKKLAKKNLLIKQFI